MYSCSLHIIFFQNYVDCYAQSSRSGSQYDTQNIFDVFTQLVDTNAPPLQNFPLHSGSIAYHKSNHLGQQCSHKLQQRSQHFYPLLSYLNFSIEIRGNVTNNPSDFDRIAKSTGVRHHQELRTPVLRQSNNILVSGDKITPNNRAAVVQLKRLDTSNAARPQTRPVNLPSTSNAIQEYPVSLEPPLKRPSSALLLSGHPAPGNPSTFSTQTGIDYP